VKLDTFDSCHEAVRYNGHARRRVGLLKVNKRKERPRSVLVEKPNAVQGCSCALTTGVDGRAACSGWSTELSIGSLAL
jgi:hypothetical protein